MATTDNELNNLIINDLTQEQYDALVASGEVQEGQFYVTNGSGSGGGSTVSGLEYVTHDETLTGAGTDASPLGLAEAIKDEIADKADNDLGNIPTNYDYVVESQLPTAENGYTWYRKYKSGWVEQGGAKCASNTTIVFPVPMADNNYTAYAIANYASGITQAMAIQLINNRTTTSMSVASFSVGGYTVDWQVSGYASKAPNQYPSQQ